MAAFASLCHFRRLLVDRTVLLLTDNTTMAAYINRQDGTRSSSLDELAARLWRWCRSVNITPVASYIPGQDNLMADFLPRGKCLHLEIFDLLLSAWSPLEIDLFASSFNHRLPRYCSRVRDTEARALDAFSLQWGSLSGYAFPPFRLISQVLREIESDKAWVLFFAPPPPPIGQERPGSRTSWSC